MPGRILIVEDEREMLALLEKGAPRDALPTRRAPERARR